MKKLLILLIGFAFTQSIQTKQVSVTIEQWDTPLNLFTDMGLTGDRYEVKFVDVEIENGSTVCDGFNVNNTDDIFFIGLPIILRDSHLPMPTNQYAATNGASVVIDYDCNNQYGHPSEYPSLYGDLSISSMYPEVYLFPSLKWGTGTVSLSANYEQFGTTTLTFRVTGLFEDELMPDVGDMNFDGNINVVDVVLLVDSILGIG